MPYITQDRRLAIHQKARPENAGELNFAITTILIQQSHLEGEMARAEVRAKLHHVTRNYLQHKGLRYANINEVIGALVCAGFEFKRRTGRNWEQSLCGVVASEIYADVAVPYEIQKIAENGDIAYA